MAREPSVLLANVKSDAKVDIGQIKNNLADIAQRRKKEVIEHRKQLEALDKEEERERHALIKLEAKLLMVDNVAKARKKFGL